MTSLLFLLISIAYIIFARSSLLLLYRLTSKYITSLLKKEQKKSKTPYATRTEHNASSTLPEMSLPLSITCIIIWQSIFYTITSYTTGHLIIPLIFFLIHTLGSLCAGPIVAYFSGLGNALINTGSKNTGATNMFRVGGSKLAATTLIVDASKGVLLAVIAVWAIKNISQCKDPSHPLFIANSIGDLLISAFDHINTPNTHDLNEMKKTFSILESMFESINKNIFEIENLNSIKNCNEATISLLNNNPVVEMIAEYGRIVGVMAFVASCHIFPLFPNIKGGKGIAVLLGCSLTLFPPHIILIIIATWIVTFMLKNWVSLASICAALSSSIAMLIDVAYCAMQAKDKSSLASDLISSNNIISRNKEGLFSGISNISSMISEIVLLDLNFICVLFVIPALVCYTHRENIKRILNGKEQKFFLKLVSGETK